MIVGVLLAGGAGASAWKMGPRLKASPAAQPLAFSHKRHTAEGLTCANCHKGAEKGSHATLPAGKFCLKCHAEANGTSPEEPKVREYTRGGKDIPWVQVNRLPGHVYFSHAAHVTYARMDCAECHGDMKERETPVTASQVGHLDMDRCMECHREKGVSNDCLRCHK